MLTLNTVESITEGVFETILLRNLEIYFEFMGFLLSIVLLCLSFVLFSLFSTFKVCGAVNDTNPGIFFFKSSHKKYTLLCKVCICNLSEDRTSYARVVKLHFISHL